MVLNKSFFELKLVTFFQKKINKFRNIEKIQPTPLPSIVKQKILNNRLSGNLLNAKRVTYASGVSYQNQLMIITGKEPYDINNDIVE